MKPYVVLKGTITYIYDAAGNKLEKLVVDNSNSSHTGVKDTTDYTGAFQYKNDTLQFFGHEEGRIRPVTPSTYANNNGISNPDAAINTSSTSAFMYKINPSTNGGKNMGLGIALKVMAGDNITIYGKTFWQGIGSTPQNNPYAIAATSLLALIGGTPAMATNPEGITAASLNGSTITTTEVGNWLKQEPNSSGMPQAYINWVLLDDQFRPVTTNNCSGFDPVGAGGEILLHNDNVEITSNGYLYVYCSNESPVDVFFDNLQVVHTRGPLMETTHYYPFGLTMAGISDEAFKTDYKENKYRFQKQELQNKEFGDGSGLEMYEFKYRFDDDQIGRFWSVDPLSDKYVYNSPYAFSENKVTNAVELEGLEAEWLVNDYYRTRERVKEEKGEQAQQEFDQGYRFGGKILKKAAIATVVVVQPEVGIPLALSDLTGFPVTPSPQAMEGVVATEAEGASEGAFVKTEGSPASTNATTAGSEAQGASTGPSDPITISNDFHLSSSSNVSPNVGKTLSMLNDIKAEGGTVKLNPLAPNQELNMTIQHNSLKLDFRVETHDLPIKLGGMEADLPFDI